jgi:DNA polymerase III alpha subunit
MQYVIIRLSFSKYGEAKTSAVVLPIRFSNRASAEDVARAMSDDTGHAFYVCIAPIKSADEND